MKALALAGLEFGRLTVIHRSDNTKSNQTSWLCLCSCGATVAVVGHALNSGQTRSCGCLQIDATKSASTTHGASIGGRVTSEYTSWLKAKERCFDSRHEKFKFYGGRGITVCDRWRNDFGAFLCDMGPRPNGATLDRKDPNGDYEPSNCRWATKATQSRNTRSNVFVDFNGTRMVLKDAAAAAGVDYKRLHRYVRYRNITLAKAIAHIQSGKRGHLR